MIPALNIARELRSRHPGIEVIFIGTQRGLESDLVPREGFELAFVPVVPLSRRPSTSWFRFPFALLKSIATTMRIIRKRKIDIVVATGGYASGPAIIASWLSRRPLVLCEQNSYPGITSRVGSIFASVVCSGLPGARDYLCKRSQLIETGNPIDIICTSRTREQVIAGFNLDPAKRLLLVTGGSQGSAKINGAILELIKNNGLPEGWSLLWQTGKDKYYPVLSQTEGMHKDVTIVPFISPLCEAYLACDAIICRCGALTLSEISYYGIPAILIPYPFAAGDHQRKNAETFAGEGAAVVLDDAELTGSKLSQALGGIICDEALRLEMSSKMRKLGRPDATRDIADIIEKTAKKQGKVE